MNSLRARSAGADLDPAEDLVATARYGVPTVPPLHVSRPRLTAMLDASGGAPLVLVSGPAGSGKTTLVAEWLGRGGAAGDEVAWVGFEDQDTRLWQPVTASLARHGLRLPDQGHEPHVDRLLGRSRLAALAEAIAASPRRWTLVLDGFELRTPELAAEVAYLLGHGVGRLRVVLTTRVDPVLPLYRYRLADTLVEVRAADLAFTDVEAGELMRRGRAGLHDATVHELNARLGGWAAGLRFAARTLTRQGHPEESASAVVAQDSDTNEYLLAEVLDVQSPGTRRLLLETCVPDVLYAGLAEALAGPQAAHGLAALARSNMFLEPVPEQPGCYRYHPFFRDLLRAQLAWEDPEGSARLHRRAAAWLRGGGMLTRAVAQLAGGGLWSDAAAVVVEDMMVARLLLGQDERLVEVARRIPVELADGPSCVVRAALAQATSDPARCAEELARGRAAAAAGPDHPALALALALVDAARACTADDATTAEDRVDEAARAVDAMEGAAGPEPEGLVELAGAVIAVRRGQLDRARAALARIDETGLPAPFRIAVLGYRALAEALDGRLTQARRRAVESLSMADDAQVLPENRNPAASAALALVALERDNLQAARQHLVAARTCRSLSGDPAARVVTSGVLAHLEAAAGPEQPALEHLETVSDRAAAHDPWLAGWLRIQAAELSVAHGHADRALAALDTVALEGVVDHRLGGAVLAAAAHTERGEHDAAARSLARARESDGPLPVEVTRLLVQGAHECGRHSPEQATPLVERALRLAAQEEVRRPFREAAPSVRRLLAHQHQLLSRHRWLTPPVRPGAPARRPAVTHPTRAPRPTDPVDVEGLVTEPLTAKEREVLGHLEELLTTEEMAEKMYVSVNTIRTHVRSILRKLGVNRRNSAVRRARELGLLEPLAPTGGIPAGPLIPPG